MRMSIKVSENRMFQRFIGLRTSGYDLTAVIVSKKCSHSSQKLSAQLKRVHRQRHQGNRKRKSNQKDLELSLKLWMIEWQRKLALISDEPSSPLRISCRPLYCAWLSQIFSRTILLKVIPELDASSSKSKCTTILFNRENQLLDVILGFREVRWWKRTFH